MTLKKPHNEWRLERINALDVKAVGLDQMLTQLWLRVLHGNKPITKMGGGFQAVVEVANEIERDSNHRFKDFAKHPGLAEAWLRADLLKTFKRDPNTFSVARPLHSTAARLRNPKQDNDSYASLALYGWMKHFHPHLLERLRAFITVGADKEELDLASYALFLLAEELQEDQIRKQEPEQTFAPLCHAQPSALADDITRLLAYQGVMPRSALVDHLRRVMGLHLGLYLLRLFKIVAAVETDSSEGYCSRCRNGTTPATMCGINLDLIVDCGEDARSPVAKLAEASWRRVEDDLARYVRSHISLKKLDEFAEAAKRYSGGPIPHETLMDLAAVEKHADPQRFDAFFEQRIESMEADAGSDSRFAELKEEYFGLGLSAFRVYVSLIAQASEKRWINYHRFLLDSLLGKNTGEGVLRQPLGGRRRRRFALTASMLETLTLIAVVSENDGVFYTTHVPLHELVDHIEARYGLLISKPPREASWDPSAAAAMAQNSDRFKARLRETGLFVDLSDAFLAQTVRPRHQLQVSV